VHQIHLTQEILILSVFPKQHRNNIRYFGYRTPV